MQYLHAETDGSGPKLKIDCIKFNWIIDEDADLSHLGEFTRTPQPRDQINRQSVIVLHEHNREVYFVPPTGVEEIRRELSKLGYSRGVAEEMARRQVREDMERLDAYQDGKWDMLGCLAEATVSYPVDKHGNRRLEKFTLGGLWGIESDSDPDYLRQVEKEELADLKSHLAIFGVPTNNFSAAIQA